MFDWLWSLFRGTLYPRFTDQARQIMVLATEEARAFEHEYVGTEHLLLGLIAEEFGVGASVLRNLGIDSAAVRREIDRIAFRGPAGSIPPGKLPLTPRSRRVIEYAAEEARGLNHNSVGTEHLLLGLLREEQGVAAQVLLHLGLRLEAVRREVVNLLGPSPRS